MHMRQIGRRVAVATPSSSPEFQLRPSRCHPRWHHSSASRAGRSHGTGQSSASLSTWSRRPPSFGSRCEGRTFATAKRSSVRPKLAYEWIVNGKVLPTQEWTEINRDDEKWTKEDLKDTKETIVFLHGLLGNSKNLRTPAKKLTEKLPQCKALLLDIRGHGNSSTQSPSLSFERPHNFQSCVQDIIDTLTPLGLIGLKSPRVICGHSLGGRIALQYTHHVCLTSSLPSSVDDEYMVEPPKQTWVLDAVPGQADPSVHNVLRAISSLPTPIPSKAWLVDTLMKQYKMDKGVAMWIASNLRDKGDKSFEWIFDLGIANELVENFSDQDFARMIDDVTKEDEPDEIDNSGKNGNSTVHLVMAGKNKLWSDEIVSELRSIPSFQGTSPLSMFRMHTLDKAGHWVHVDDLDGLLELMEKGYAMIEYKRLFGAD